METLNYNFNINLKDEHGNFIDNQRFRAEMRDGCNSWHVYDVTNKFLFEVESGKHSLSRIKEKATEYLKGNNE